MDVQIRKALPEDIEVVRNLVYELAVYENEPDALKADLAHYHEQYEQGLFNCAVAELGGEIVGMTIYYLRFSTWRGKMMHLEDFYIQDAHRRKGIGELLFEAFIEDSKAQDCKMVIWQVLEWNKLAVGFYDKYNAVYDKEWWNCKLYL